MLAISVLGPPAVRRDGEPVAVPAGKTADLLVRLAVDADTFVTPERLLDDLWGVDAVHTRLNTLQSKVTRLRRALADPALVASSESGYRLAVDPSCVDARVVLDSVVEARSLLDVGDDHAAAAVCDVARRMFVSGETLPGASDWVLPHRARLDGARLALVDIECTARLSAGELDYAIRELEQAVVDYPYQEHFWSMLMTSLYRAGRQADALSAFRRVRDRLGEDLGLDPGPALRELERQILVHDPALTTAPAIRALPIPQERPGNIPTLPVELIGRERELEALAALVAGRSLVEIIGVAGVGKTALATAVVRSVSAPGGVWLVRLEETSTRDEVIDSIVGALHIAGGEAALYERLKSIATVIVVDNCEHVVDSAALVVGRLLDEAPHTKVLCTSQVALGIDGETIVELEPLGLADAVTLFATRAASQRPGRITDDTSEELNDLCRRLDGLPLAIELAAARTKTLSVVEIKRRLDDRFGVLRDPGSRKPERRRALKAAIGWSYELLFADDQRGLWALATFPGGATLEGLEHVLETLDVPSRTAIDVVGRLANRSLVIVDVAAGSTRYRLLESIREFALGALEDAGRTDAAFAANAAWIGDIARDFTDGVRSERQAEYLAVARSERANIDATLTWCTAHDPLLGVHIASGFGWGWVVLGDSRGAQRILTALAGAGDQTPTSEWATCLLLAGWLEASTGNLEPARTHIADVAEFADRTGDQELRARCDYHLAYVVSHEGDFRAALDLTEHSRSFYTDIDRPWDAAANALFATRAATSAGDIERAVDEAEWATGAIRAIDDPWMHVRFEAMLGELARLQHRFDDAVVHLTRATTTSHERGYLQTEAYQLSCLGRAQCQAGDYRSGASTLQQAIDNAEATGDVRMAALARVHLGRILRALGESGRARVALEHAQAWHETAGGGEQAILGRCLLAAMDLRDGGPDALGRLDAVLTDARRSDDAPSQVFALDALARMAVTSGDVPKARTLVEEANRRMTVSTHFITELDRVDAPRFRHPTPRQ